ncbi:hypothetical protein K438DRAFT_476953 [Mycena galopus ATCC 62051]|nr:hypothetical protein K438DRAFT_476953 [Mycena galopus ATCC 62051]
MDTPSRHRLPNTQLPHVMSVIKNALITIMICVRTWLALRGAKNSDMSSSFWKRFIAVAVESGLLYLLVLLITVIFFPLGNNGLEILSGSNTQILGIITILLSLQLQLNLSTYDHATATRVGTGQASVYHVEFDGVGAQTDETLHSEMKRERTVM